ncbi:Holliday junction branch migration protein RuvA [Paeniglutamicibacter antarcticus]|uniref:Holliday junction branch migration complex subunit RuvA n=1 Tax=Arthrobacter terrae TaxID=2935737 RepID=A0A931G702_9MICC|nr:Holliday junction branch migration protein RuvA [Arthrobacter terrae]MBG0741613.1 Holliday junction branch migration protein RuvA [Arthrobacter terrae]
MISFVRGPVAQIGLSSAVIDVHGIGMLVHAAPKTLGGLRTGQEATLVTSMIVREDSMTLYGFANSSEREVFDVLLSVSGIGPRLALAVLAVHEPETIRVAVAGADGKTFTKVPGIGPKVAGRIVLELTGKLLPEGTGASGSTAAGAAGPAAWKPQVIAAMTGLGWSEKDAAMSIDKATADEPVLLENANVAAILRATLRWLGQDVARVPSAGRAGARG